MGTIERGKFTKLRSIIVRHVVLVIFILVGSYQPKSEN